MLLNTAPKVSDIVTIRLYTGEEVIGRMESRSDNTVTLKKPVVLHVQQTPSGLDVRFGALLVSAEADTVTFHISALSFAPLLTREDLKQGYQQATSTIVTPPSGLITP